MGAFWHLFLPVKVHITMNKNEFEAISENRIALPEPFAKDFFEVNRNEWSDENRFSGTRHKINLTYMLSDKHIDMIRPFLNDAWQLIRSEKTSIIPKGLDGFIKKNLMPLQISGVSFEKMAEHLRNIEDNYYLTLRSNFQRL